MAAPVAAAVSPTTASPPHAWSELLPELLGRVIANLPLPDDLARFRAVCHPWRAAAHHHARRLPWLVLPDGSFFTIAGDDVTHFHLDGDAIIPGVPKPEGATCVGSTDAWLALDCAGDEAQRSYLLGKICGGCCCSVLDEDVKHKPSYLLHNPFTGATVPLPELDGVIGSASRRLEIRKVLMRSSSPDDIVAVVTNNWNYNVIICRPGKGTDVLRYYRVIDIAFLGDWLYGITPDEHLFAFRLEDDDGKPIVAEKRRFIMNPLPEGKEDYWSWIDEDSDDDDANNDDDHGDGDGGSDNDNNEDENKEEEEAGDVGENKEEAEGNSSGDEEADDEKKDADDEAQNKEEDDESDSSSDNDDEDRSRGDGMISDGEVIECNEESSNDPKGYTITRRKLVKSRAGELLMVRQHVQVLPSSGTYYTCKVEIFKADIDAGNKWLPITGSFLAEDEALFLSRSFSKSTHVHGDIKPGFIYFDVPTDAFDTTSWTCVPSSLPLQIDLVRSKWSTWIFPQELVV